MGEPIQERADVGRDRAFADRQRAGVAVTRQVELVLEPVGAVGALRKTHTTSKELLATLEKAGREARTPFGPGTDPRPVVVTTAPLVPQLLWEGYDHFRWLDPHNADLATYAQRLAAGGAKRVVLVPSEATPDVAAMAPWYREIDRPRLGRHRFPPEPVVVLERTP